MTHPQNPQAGQAYPGQPQAGQAPYPGQPYAQQPQYGVPGPYGAPPAYQAPIQPPKKKKWPWIVGILVALIVIIAAVSGGGDDSSDKTASSGSSNSGEQADSGGDNGDNGDKKADEQAAGLNTPVRDGKFEFVVTNVESGLSSVGDNEFLTAEAQGQFVVVTMTVNNTSKEPKDFSPTNQKLVDTEGRSFEPDTTAQIYLGGSDIPVWDNVNPGNTVEVKVVYDMPVDAKPASIELHDSMFSGGVKVNLG
ncbi:DUF4352 domain-containing protein [Gordonia rubripertincta]|uniref:DUF4352 domain-containing protein n=1 Tax=Gordonia rubripertincta TaxID=36822 RepID=A0AAW4G2T8_GORRU|nr:DUF4352 domain-containing protein [Gordonia rubripertincta]MBM7277393.1 DUF4352 domain-containing protein [Gordonia rubripertincta]QMU20459.1 DUF4352 domain-containing protein [Gordonia rubripertincta]